MTTPPALRPSCPPGTCTCGREEVPAIALSDPRILRLTRHEENRLLARLENIESLDDLQHLQQRLYDQLGIRLEVAPRHGEVRSMRGISIRLAEQPGLCRKTRQSIPAAVRRALEKRPEIAYRLLDTHDLLRDA